MTKRFWLIPVVASLAAGIAYAQYPILDMVAGKVVQKYQSSSCEQLWQKKGEPKSAGRAAHHRPPAKRPADAYRVHRQGRRADREQDVRMRNDPLMGHRPGGESW